MLRHLRSFDAQGRPPCRFSRFPPCGSPRAALYFKNARSLARLPDNVQPTMLIGMNAPTPSSSAGAPWSVGILVVQKALGWLAAALLLAGFAALADGLAAEMRRGPNRLDVLPGSVTPLSGPIPVKQAEPADFFVRGGPPDGQVRLELDDFFAGYWFGSGMWRGKLVVGAEPGMGEYPFVVEFRDAPPKAAQTYRVAVWPDAGSLRAASFSRLTREYGLPSFSTAAALLAAGLLSGLGNFLAGRRWHAMLRRQGCAEIYKLPRARDGGREAVFGMGAVHGVVVGQECEVLRPGGETAFRAVVAFCEPRHASLLLPPDTAARPGWVARPLRDGAPNSVSPGPRAASVAPHVPGAPLLPRRPDARGGRPSRRCP